MPYVWIAVLVAAIVVESQTADLVAIWFFPSALVSMIMAFCNAPVPAQLLVFVCVGLALLFALRPLCSRFLNTGRNAKTNVDALIGKTCIVTEEINNINGEGEVKVGGLCWSARSHNDSVIAVGTHVQVLEVQGVKLIVREGINK